MKAQDWNEELLAEHRDSIADAGARAAFDSLVERSIQLPGFACSPQWQGDVRHFIYTDKVSSERPFSFIVNHGSLLFYVRQAGLTRVAGGKAALQALFADVQENKKGEWKVRLSSRTDGERLNSFLFRGAERSSEE